MNDFALPRLSATYASRHWPSKLTHASRDAVQADTSAFAAFGGYWTRAIHAVGHVMPPVALAIMIALSQGVATAYNGGAHSQLDTLPAKNSPAYDGQTASISIEVAHKTLCEVMRQIRTRSGADVKVSKSTADDLISRSVRGNTWQAAVERLLEGYNYSAVWGDDGQPLQLTVYGRNHYADDTPTVTQAPPNPDLLVYAASAFGLPQRYQGMNPGSVNEVSLPVEQMKQMKPGDKFNLTLPCGQFSVVYEDGQQQEDGKFSWLGYLESVGKTYRVIIHTGTEGIQGQLLTPSGLYNLDMEDGRTWLIEADNSLDLDAVLN